jgi:bacteriocin biosynthesis cyclodehydratase domain-containing protein
VQVLRRGAGLVQIGVGAQQLLLPDGPELRQALGVLRAGEERVRLGPEVGSLVERLWAAGLTADASLWWADRCRLPAVAAAAYAEDPATAHDRLLRRTATRVGLSVPEPWCAEVSRLLGRAGLAVGGPDASLRLVIGVGEPDRELLDELMRAGIAHLVLRTSATRVRIGPFVVPGDTACVRCEDAHHTDRDPRWPLLVPQLVRPAAEFGTGDPDTGDPALVSLALAWAARDLATYAEGSRPATWSTTTTLDSRLEPVRHQLLRHPHCGCSWGDLLAAG